MKSQERPPVIDVHLHAMWSEINIEVPAGIRTPESYEQYRQDTFAMLQQYNIKALTSGPYVKEWKEMLPDRIISGPLIFGLGNLSVDSLRESFLKGEYEVLAEVAIQYSGVSPSDPVFDPYLSLAEELDVPVGIHMLFGPPGIAYHGKNRAHLSNPLLLEEALVRHPKIRLWVAHAGWPMLDEMVNMLFTYPQLYIDTSVINWVIPRKEFYHYLRRIVDAGFCDRVLFGSDQIHWPDAISLAIESINSADFLTREQKRDILYNNAAKFLRIENI